MGELTAALLEPLITLPGACCAIQPSSAARAS